MDYRMIFLTQAYDGLEKYQRATFLHFTIIISAAALHLFGLLNPSWNLITPGWVF